MKYYIKNINHFSEEKLTEYICILDEEKLSQVNATTHEKRKNCGRI